MMTLCRPISCNISCQVQELQKLSDSCSRGSVQQREIRLTQISIAIVVGRYHVELTIFLNENILPLCEAFLTKLWPILFYFQFSSCVML